MVPIQLLPAERAPAWIGWIAQDKTMHKDFSPPPVCKRRRSESEARHESFIFEFNPVRFHYFSWQDGFSIFDVEDCVTPLLLHLSVRHVSLLSQVNRMLRKTCGNLDVWAGFCLRDFGEDADKIRSLYEKAEFPGSPRGGCLDLDYRTIYRKMMSYEIELHFLSGPMGNPIIKVIGSECTMETPKGGLQHDRVVSIGRSRQNDVSILKDEMVSRNHAEVFRKVCVVDCSPSLHPLLLHCQSCWGFAAARCTRGHCQKCGIPQEEL